MPNPAEPPPAPAGEDALYTISDDPGLLDLKGVHRYLAEESYWARGIARETVERSVRHSLCFGVYHHGMPGRVAQAGFARVVSDHATFAYLADVFILPEHRGRGLSKRLIATILAHPQLQGLRRWALATRDAHGLYRQFGFEPLLKPENRMERR